MKKQLFTALLITGGFLGMKGQTVNTTGNQNISGIKTFYNNDTNQSRLLFYVNSNFLTNNPAIQIRTDRGVGMVFNTQGATGSYAFVAAGFNGENQALLDDGGNFYGQRYMSPLGSKTYYSDYRYQDRVGHIRFNSSTGFNEICISPSRGNDPVGTGIWATVPSTVPSTVTTTNYTLEQLDSGFTKLFTSGSPVTVTIPANANNSILVGTVIKITQQGTGTVTIIPQSGVFITKSTSLPFKMIVGETRVFTKIAIDTWLMEGNSLPNINVLPNSNVGIGTDNPSEKLEVNGNSKINGNEYVTGNMGIGTTTPDVAEGWNKVLDVRGVGHSKIMANTGNVFSGIFSHDSGFYGTPSGGFAGTTTNHPFSIITNRVNRMTFLTNGNIGIGTQNPDAKLTVKGQIHAEEVKVDLNVPVPDYVFEKEYNLLPLEKVADYVKTNKHLPEIPSEAEFLKTGLNLGEMNMILLKKLEELTLYLIEEHKKNEAQQKEIEALRRDAIYRVSHEK